MPTRSFTIVPQGPFSLHESAVFGFGQRVPSDQRPEARFDGVLRMAFCLDGYREQVGVLLRQDPAGVHVEVHGEGDLDAVRVQVARVLSLDHDATGFVEVGRRDPVIGRLQQAAPGLRPPLFYSPYEAAAWSLLSARRPALQMAAVRAALSEEHGRPFQLAGRRLSALPTPAQLLEVDAFPGTSPETMTRLHGLARAALDGSLDTDRLQALGPYAALAQVRRIKGIGPFYAQLIVVRGTGFTDVLPVDEPRSLALVRQLYGLAAPPSADEFAAIAEAWQPFRTWCAVLIRAAGKRVLSTEHRIAS